MKKLSVILLALLLCAALTACGSGNTKSAGNTSVNSVSDVLDARIEEEDATEPAAEPEIVPAEEDIPADTGSEASGTAYNAIDIDLTKMSSTMVYSEVYSMLAEPDTFLGEVVKMEGMFAIYQAYDENGEPVNDNIYFACVVPDATACCQQGIEFVPAADMRYPDDYPELGADITVTGIFQTYLENGCLYVHLVNAEMTEA